jgi:hypothetical protein
MVEMTLVEWTKDTFKRGPELFADEEQYVDKNSKATVTRDLRKLKACSLGIVSCDDPSEWYLICRHNAPVGTSLEEYDESIWKPMFEELRVIVRAQLTSALLTQRSAKGAKILLDVLERRDKEHWQKDAKAVEVSTNDGNKTTNITFKVI